MNKNKNLDKLLCMIELTSLYYQDLYTTDIVEQIREISIEKADEAANIILSSIDRRISYNLALTIYAIRNLSNEKDRISWLNRVINNRRFKYRDDELIDTIKKYISASEQEGLMKKLREATLAKYYRFGWFGSRTCQSSVTYIEEIKRFEYKPSIEDIYVVLNNTRGFPSGESLVDELPVIVEMLCEKDKVYFLEKFLHLILCESKRDDDSFESSINCMKKLLGRELSEEENRLFIKKLIWRGKYYDAAKRANESITDQKEKHAFFEEIALKSLEYDLCPEIKDFLFSKDGAKTLAKIASERIKYDMFQARKTPEPLDLYKKAISSGALKDSLSARILYLYMILCHSYFVEIINDLPSNRESSIIKKFVACLAIDVDTGRGEILLSNLKKVINSEETLKASVKEKFQEYFEFFKI